MIRSFSWTSFTIIVVFVTLSESACTFPSEITGDWYSAYKGKLSFNSTHVSGYPIYMSASVQSLDFECYINSDRKYLLRATETALVFGQYIRGYLCIQLWRVSSTKYYYYHGTTISPTNNDHIKGVIDILKNGTLEETCDIAEPYNTSSFITLVKDGTITTGASEATCATDLLASYSAVSITDSTGSTSCSNNVMDGCTDRTEMRFTYDAGCGNTHKFSTGGFWTCMQSMSSGGYTYLSLWNNDSSVTGTTTYTYTSGVNYQFACLVISGSSASMFPNYCSDSTQTATSVSSPGLTMAFTGATQTCYDEVEGGSSAVYYITIVLGSLFIIALIILIIILKKKGYCSFQKCKKDRPNSPESTVEQGEHVNNTVFRMNKLDPIPGFRAKRPLRIGPIVEPNLDILPKVEPLYALSDKKDTSKPAKRDDDTVSVDSVEDEDNPFNFYNIAKFVLLPKIVSKKSFDVGALSDPKRNTLHDILEIKKSKLKRESKASEEQEKKDDKNKEGKDKTKEKVDKEKENDKKKTKGKPKLEKQTSKEPKPGNKNRRMSKK